MSVYTSNSKAGPYIADGDQRMFPFNFAYFEDAHVSVYRGETKIPQDEYLVERPAGYNPETGDIEGGSIVFFKPPIGGTRITILREVPATQETDIQNSTAFYPEIMEDGLDKLTMLCQQIAEVLGRCVKVDVGSTTKPEDLIDMIFGAKDIALTAAEGATNANAAASAALLSISTIWAEITGIDASAQVALVALKQAFEAAGSVEAAAAAGRESVNEASLAAVDYAKGQIEESKNASVQVLSATTKDRKAELLALISETVGAEGTVAAAVKAAEDAAANAKNTAGAIDAAAQETLASINASIGVAEEKRALAAQAAASAQAQAEQAGDSAAEAYKYIADTLANKNASAQSAQTAAQRAQDAAQSAASAQIAANAAAGAAGEAAQTAAAQSITAHNNNVNSHPSKLSLSGGTMTGTLTVAPGNSILTSEDTSVLRIYGGSTQSAGLFLFGKDSSNKGFVYVRASDGTNTKDLVLRPDGRFTWNDSAVLTADGGTLTGTLFVANGESIKQGVDNGVLRIYGGKDTSAPALFLFGKNMAGGYNGQFYLRANDGSVQKDLVGRPDGTLTWGGSAVVCANSANTVFLRQPNYAAGTTTTASTYTASADGWVSVTKNNRGYYVIVRINGVFAGSGGGSDYDQSSFFFPVKKGDVVTTFGADNGTTTTSPGAATSCEIIFYPNR